MTSTSLIDILRQRFTRVTSTGEYFPQIDGLRLLAVLLVFGHHVIASYLVHTHRLGTQQLPRDWALIAPRSPLVHWALHLAFGVPLFCAISGFVLSIPFARSYIRGAAPPSIRAYLLRRLIRLEPPYVLNMLLMFLFIVIPWHQADPAGYFGAYFRAFAPHLLASLIYLHAAVFADSSWINGVAWTLEIEVQFYLVLPFLAMIFLIRHPVWRRVFLISLILITALVSQLVGQPSGSIRFNLSLAIQLHFFLAGLLLADLCLTPPRILREGPPRADVLALLSAVLLVVVLHWAPQLAWTEPFLIVGFYFGVFSGAWSSRIFRLRALTILGGMSYTTYLYHMFIIDRLLPYTIRLFPPNHALLWDVSVQFLLLLPPVLCACAILFVATERPCMILSREVTRRFRHAPVPVSSS